MSYLISKNGELLAEVPAQKSRSIQYSYVRVVEEINTNREYSLVNARSGKISNAKKWEKIARYSILDSAEEINENEFYIIN